MLCLFHFLNKPVAGPQGKPGLDGKVGINGTATMTTQELKNIHIRDENRFNFLKKLQP